MSRARLLLTIVLVLAVLAGGTIIARIWGLAFTDDVTMVKLLASYVVGALMASFAVIVLVDYQGSKTRKLLLGLFVLAELLGLFTLFQIWIQVFEWGTFAKIAGSMLVAILLAGFAMAAIEDFDEDRDLKKKNYLD